MEKSQIKLKIKNLLTSTVLITGENTSNLVLSPNAQAGMKNIQTVVQVGPHIKPENGYDIKSGDKVLLNLEGLEVEQANGKVLYRPVGQPITFDNETGEFIGYYADKNKENEIQYWLVDSRRILLVIE